MRTGKKRLRAKPQWIETAIRLSPGERRVLRHLCRAGRTGAWVAVRARCVLLAARGVGTKAIARAVGRAPQWVRQWRDRFARDRLNGLVDTPRPGRPARFSPRRAS
jgi:hypothetical protein